MFRSIFSLKKFMYSVFSQMLFGCTKYKIKNANSNLLRILCSFFFLTQPTIVKHSPRTLVSIIEMERRQENLENSFIRANRWPRSQLQWNDWIIRIWTQLWTYGLLWNHKISCWIFIFFIYFSFHYISDEFSLFCWILLI